MHKNGLRFNKWWLLGAFLSLFINQPSLFAQKKQVYEGPFLLNNDSVIGLARYGYVIAEKDTLFDGPFEFQRTQILENIGQRMKVGALDLSGTYERGLKYGDWHYAFKKLTPGKELRVNKYDVSYPANGNTLQVFAKFKYGIPNGSWLYVRKTVHEGVPKDTLSLGKINFTEGVITGNLKLIDLEVKLSGQFTETGQLDGNWIFSGLSDSIAQEELRKYTSGWLTKHQIIFDGKTYILNHKWHQEPDTTGEETLVPMQETYREILRLATRVAVTDLKLDPKTVLKLKACVNANTDFILNHLYDFQQDDGFSIWNSLEKDALPMDFGRIHVNKYEKSQAEKDTIKWALSVIENLQEQLEMFFENPFAEIGRFSYQGLAEVYVIFSEYRKALPQYKAIRRLLNEPALEYFPRNEIMPYLVPDIQFEEKLSIDFDGQNLSFEHVFPKTLNGDFKVPEHLWIHLNDLQQDIKDNVAKAERLLDIARKETALGDLEADLVRTKDSVQKMFSGSYKNYNSYHQNLSESVLKLIETSFQDYMKREVEQKKETIDDAIQCNEDLIKVYSEMIDIPRKLERLDKEYTRTVWNAHLMVDMDERVKERLYNAIIDYAFPYLVNRQQENLSCEDPLYDIQLIQELYDRMISIRNEDTKDLERKLRREKNPTTILEFIGVEIPKN